MKDDAQKKSCKSNWSSNEPKHKRQVPHSSTKLVVDILALKLSKFAKKGKYDMIVIGARGMGGAKEAFLGSTSNYVMHKTKVPVLVVK